MTEYKRIQGRSYMVCKSEDGCDGYERFMLQNNTISGLLPLQIEDTENGQAFWYDITGRHDLESYAKLHKMNSTFLCNFLSALQQTVQKTGEFLLQDDGISLLPGRIFLDFEEQEIRFCYTIFDKIEFTTALRTFMEYFLQHMEHGSQNDVQKCYEIYEYCQSEHVDLEVLLKTFFDMQNYDENSENEEMPKDTLMKEEITKSPIDKIQKTKKRLFPKIKRKEETVFVYEPEDAEEEPLHPTVFLGSETEEILGELRYEGDGAQKNIIIHAKEFLIGKEEGEADGLIFTPTVSRIHAKITKEEGVYYIEDMNSTNGTYQNGRQLNYKEKVLLQKNDIIKFAEEAYRFV